jgi:hypothetical protein
VVRNGLSGDHADRLLDDITAATTYLDRLSSPMPRRVSSPRSTTEPGPDRRRIRP